MAGLRINFDTLGDRSIASSRLRAWMLADELRARGHDARVNSPLSADVQVFQKVRPTQRLKAVADHGALVVADFDDNYLLEEVGTRDDVVRFMNCAHLVTVGSQHLLEAASFYHDRVVLLENPLDVPRTAPRRPPRAWEGRLGWFGNPTNLAALEGLNLTREVTTITRHGDIEWDLDTIDAHLAELDLVLLPVAEGDWNLAKNANRLLKCVALGVPFLASRTPEHERVAELLGLPRELFVEAGADWEERIELIGETYVRLLTALDAARERALDRYGVGQVAAEWLSHVENARTDQRTVPRSPAAGASFADLDVVILNENEPARSAATLGALGVDNRGYRSLTVVSAWAEEPELPPYANVYAGHGDFFDTYQSLAAAMPSSDKGRTLVLRAGARPTAGFFSELVRTEGDSESAWLFATQLVGEPGDDAGRPPHTLEHALRRPFVPDALVCPNRLLRASGPLLPDLAGYALWDLVIALMEGGPDRVRHHATPLVLIEPVLRTRTLLDSYYAWVRANDPSRTSQLPSKEAEWQRLRQVLFTHIVERHRETYERHVSALLPAVERSLLAREQERAALAEARATLRAELYALARRARGRFIRVAARRLPPSRRKPVFRILSVIRQVAKRMRSLGPGAR